MNYYFFYGPSIKKILGRYADLPGRMPLPPLWAKDGVERANKDSVAMAASMVTARDICSPPRQRHGL